MSDANSGDADSDIWIHQPQHIGTDCQWDLCDWTPKDGTKIWCCVVPQHAINEFTDSCSANCQTNTPCINFRLPHLSLIVVSVIFISCKPLWIPLGLWLSSLRALNWQLYLEQGSLWRLFPDLWLLSVWLFTTHHADILITSFRCQEIVSLTFPKLTHCVARHSNLSSTDMGKESLRYFSLTFWIFLSSWNHKYPVQNWIANEEPHDNTMPDSHPTCCSMHFGRSQYFLGWPRDLHSRWGFQGRAILRHHPAQFLYLHSVASPSSRITTTFKNSTSLRLQARKIRRNQIKAKHFRRLTAQLVKEWLVLQFTNDD